MSSSVFIIRIQDKQSETAWKVHAEYRGDSTGEKNDIFEFSREDFRHLNTLSTKDYGIYLGKALFQNDLREFFKSAFHSSQKLMKVTLSIDVEHSPNSDDLRALHWERLCVPIAHSIVEAETTNLSLPCKANFFGVRNPDDSATELSADRLVKPLSEFFTSNKKFLKKNSHWEIETYLAEQATKAQLSQLLGGEETPALLFTASHGVGFPNQHKRQISHQGALVCQEWPGPEFSGPIPEGFYFSGDDISSSDRLFGLISFHFACYGAGTPKIDQFGHKNNKWEQIAPYPFVANLPQRLLSHPQGGALAFVSHVDRAWGQSFYWQGEEQIGSFQSTLQRLIEGHPIGSALETLNQRYAAVSSELTKELWYIKAGRTSNDSALSYLWTTNNDARGYAIIGDPAVGLMVGNNASKMEKRREINQPVEFSSDLSATISHTTEKDFSSLVELLNSLVQKIEKDQQQHALFDNLIDLLKNLAEKVKQAKTDKNLSEFEKLFKEFAETVKQLEIS